MVSAREVASSPISTLAERSRGWCARRGTSGQCGRLPKVLTLDGGGTSTDVAVVESGSPHLTTEGRVGRFPVKVPMTDVVTVGAGRGGSIARRASDGRLKVGPESAGAEPGPMCYGRGGRRPTVTDATLVLGRVPPHLLGGEIPLEIGRAQQGLADLAASLGLDVHRTAAGILEIAAWSQANAVRQVTVKRGLDIRDYVLVAFGGSSSAPGGQAGRHPRLAGRALVPPPDPGNVSAFGLLTVDVRTTTSGRRSARRRARSRGGERPTYARLEHQARDALAARGFTPRDAGDQGRDMRYFGQAWEVRVEVPDGPIDRARAPTWWSNGSTRCTSRRTALVRPESDQRISG